MAPPGAWWFAPDGWVGWVSMKPGDRGISAGAGKGVCRNGQPQQAAGSGRQYCGKREERLAGRRYGKQNRRPLRALLPDERGTIRLSDATSQPETTAPPSHLEYKNTKTVLS